MEGAPRLQDVPHRPRCGAQLGPPAGAKPFLRPWGHAAWQEKAPGLEVQFRLAPNTRETQTCTHKSCYTG